MNEETTKIEWNFWIANSEHIKHLSINSVLICPQSHIIILVNGPTIILAIWKFHNIIFQQDHNLIKLNERTVNCDTSVGLTRAPYLNRSSPTGTEPDTDNMCNGVSSYLDLSTHTFVHTILHTRGVVFCRDFYM